MSKHVVCEYSVVIDWPLARFEFVRLTELAKIMFCESGREVQFSKLESKDRVVCVFAHCNKRLIGFKIGYGMNQETFYSWIGGVHSDFRKHGIGSELMRRQHEYLSECGYREALTVSSNKWQEMLKLNRKSGFEVVGTYLDEGETRIKLRKDI